MPFTVIAHGPAVFNGLHREDIVIRTHTPGKVAVCSRLVFAATGTTYVAGTYFADTPAGFALAFACWAKRCADLAGQNHPLVHHAGHKGEVYEAV